MYSIEFAPAAKRQFDKLPKDIQQRLAPRIEALASDPRPSGCMKLSGGDSEYRIRIGDYRVVYDVSEQQLRILVLKVGDRNGVYR